MSWLLSVCVRPKPSHRKPRDMCVVCGACCRAQQKAKEAVVAVTAVEVASKQLDAAQANASMTITKLHQAAHALQSITNVTAKNRPRDTWALGNILTVGGIPGP